jgi:hypothetical protein
VIACSLPPLVVMQVTQDDGLNLEIDDGNYYNVDYFTVVIVYLNVLDSGCKY